MQKAALFIVISPVAGLLLAAGLMWLLNQWLRRHQESGNETVFKAGQLVSSAAVSLGHGTNDAQKTICVVAALLVAELVALSDRPSSQLREASARGRLSTSTSLFQLSNHRCSPSCPRPVARRGPAAHPILGPEMVNAGKDDQPRDQGVARMQTGARGAVAIRSLALMPT